MSSWGVERQRKGYTLGGNGQVVNICSKPAHYHWSEQRLPDVGDWVTDQPGHPFTVPLPSHTKPTPLA